MRLLLVFVFIQILVVLGTAFEEVNLEEDARQEVNKLHSLEERLKRLEGELERCRSAQREHTHIDVEPHYTNASGSTDSAYSILRTELNQLQDKYDSLKTNYILNYESLGRILNSVERNACIS